MFIENLNGLRIDLPRPLGRKLELVETVLQPELVKVIQDVAVTNLPALLPGVDSSLVLRRAAQKVGKRVGSCRRNRRSRVQALPYIYAGHIG